MLFCLVEQTSNGRVTGSVGKIRLCQEEFLMNMNFQNSDHRANKLRRAKIAEDMVLPIGEHITVCSSDNRRLEGKILGYESDNVIIIRQCDGDSDVALSPGAKLNAHFVMGDFTIVAFLSTLIAKIKLESSIVLFCRYPQRFISSTQRNGVRVDCLLPVTVKKDEEVVLGVLTNLSFKGCQLTFDSHISKIQDSFSIDQEINIFLNPFDVNSSSWRILGDVRYVLEGEYGTKFGVDFIEIGEAAMGIVRKYINEHQRKYVMGALQNVASQAVSSDVEIKRLAESAAVALTKGEEHRVLSDQYMKKMEQKS